MVMPGHLQDLSWRERRRARDRIRREAPRVASRERTPARSPSTFFAVLAAMLVCGGLLLGRLHVRYPGRSPSDRQAKAAKELGVLRVALERFRSDCGRYPYKTESLKALVLDPGLEDWAGPYVTLIKPDPWHTPYRYSLASNCVSLMSCGLDRTMGTDDDLYAPPLSEISP